MTTTSRGTFLGKPLEEMTREELMDAIELLAKQLQSAREDAASSIRFMRDVMRLTRRR